MESFKMNWGRAILISLPFFGITIFWQAYDYIVPLMLVRHFHTSTIGYSMIMSIDNVAALVLLPVFGILSDRVNSRMGRRTPLILWGTIGGLMGLVGMNLADSYQLSISTTERDPLAFILFLFALLIAVVCMSAYRSPATALVADVFIRPLRTKANAMLNFLGGSAGVAFALIGRALLQRGLSLTIYFVALTMVITLLIYLALFRENKTVAKVQKQVKDLGIGDKKTIAGDTLVTKLTKPEFTSLMAILGVVALMYMGYNAFSTHYSNFLTRYLMQDASWTTPFLLRVLLVLIFAFPAAAIASKIGRRKAAIIGLGILAFSFFGMSFIRPDNVNTLYLWSVVFAVGFPLVSINVGPMVLELAKDRDAGRYMGYYYIAATIAQIITPTLASLFIETFNFGFGALTWYAMSFTIFALICALFIKHGDVKPILKTAVAGALETDD